MIGGLPKFLSESKSGRINEEKRNLRIRRKEGSSANPDSCGVAEIKVQKSLTNDDQTSLGTTLAWKGVVPPHAKLTAWFLFHQRLNTKDRLCHLKNHPTYRSNLSFL